ncbi:MAG: hypothetical protein INR69_23530 [Mucilaginibacter polytrichastri]|nr:hypothetical protein [Mucilaginibacter polytrichastri]
MRSLIRFIFFGNYFIGLLAVALSVEAVAQLHLPLNSVFYYLLVFSATVMYYNFAYVNASRSYASGNPRSAWYGRHHRFVQVSQTVFFAIAAGLSAYFAVKNFYRILHLPLYYWLGVALMLLSAIGYYGLLPKKFISVNLRSHGFIKPFVIGLVWACCVTLLPVIMLRVESDVKHVNLILLLWLMLKNWMFCTVNAILFDMKDYADDANRQLKTFVVRFGLRRTIFYILLPLSLVGILAGLSFTEYMHFPLWAVLVNLIPFLLLLLITWSMHRKHQILYYLVIIDGLLLVKAVCGIISASFILE